MQRMSLVLLLVISLLTGFAIRSMVFRTSPSVDSSSDSANLELATGFYDAVNRALAGAPVAPVAARLSPIFVSHRSDTGTDQSADGFLDEVRAIGASPQRLRLEVLSVEATGGNVVAGIHFVQEGAVEVAGVTVEQSRPGPHYEVLRLERGEIVDRWAPDFHWLDASEPEDAQMTISSFSGIATTLMRVELIDSNEHEWRAMGLGLVIVESGSALLQISRGTSAEAAMVLEQGQIASIPNGVRARLRPVDGHLVSVMIYVTSRIGPSSAAVPMGQLGGGVPADSMSVLWSGNHYWTQSATVHRLARIVLPDGGVVELTRSPGADLLLAGDAGVLQVGTAGGSVTVLGEDRWPVISERDVLIDASHAASIGGDGVVFVRNMSDAPVTLLLVSIEEAPVPTSPVSRD